MSDEPRNAAACRIFEGLATWRDPESMKASWNDHHAEDFVRVDRRRLISSPDADRAKHLQNQLLWFELGDGQPTFGAEVLVVRGDRLALVRAATRYANGQGREALTVVTFDQVIKKTTRNVHFDLDDFDAALVELERQHVKIDTEEV